MQPLASGLRALEDRLAHDLACLQLPLSRWTPPLQHEGQAVADVAIIGGGMAGLALAAALQHQGMAVAVYDEAPAGWEGPWATTARMETLRSPKHLAGPALGIASLSFRAWFEAQFGAAAWDALDKIPRLQWMDYLRWYRQVLGLVVHNEHRVTDVLPRADGQVQLKLAVRDRTQSAWARRVVLATGRAGLGGPWMPEFAHGLSTSRRVHSSEPFDYATLQGLRVGVIEAGASAMDSAATALEEGAARVHLLVRRRDIPRINKGKGASHPGFVHGHALLPDDWKWRIRHYINVQQVPPRAAAPCACRATKTRSFTWAARSKVSTSSATPCACTPRRGRSSSTSWSSPLAFASTGHSGRCCATSRRMCGCGSTATNRRPAMRTPS